MLGPTRVGARWVWWLLAAILWAREAGAAPPQQTRLLYLREVGTERCPDEPRVRGAVTSRLGYDPFAERAATTVSVRLVRAPHGLHAHIELVDGTGEVMGVRDLQSRRLDCDELASAVELAISLAIDPLRAAGVTPPAGDAPPPASDGSRAKPASASVAAAPAANVRSSVSAPPPEIPGLAEALAPTSESRLRVRLGAGTLVSVGSSAGDAAVGFTLSAGLRRRRWSTNLELRADLPSRRSAAGGVVETALYLGAFVPCLHLSWAAGCAIVGVGAQVSHGIDFPVTRSVTTTYAEGGVRLAVEFPLPHRLELQVQADLLAPFTHPTLLVGDTPVYLTDAVAGVFHLSLHGYLR